MVLESNPVLKFLFEVCFPLALGLIIVAIFLSCRGKGKADFKFISFDDYMRNFFMSHGQGDRIEEVMEKVRKDPFGKLYSPIVYKGAKIFARWGFTPNKITLLDFILVLFVFWGTVMAGQGHHSEYYVQQPMWGIWFILIGFLIVFIGLIDGMDGALATLTNQKSRVGGWFDGVMDRFGDLVLMVCVVPTQMLVIEELHLDLTWIAWVNFALIVIYEYMRAKQFEVGLTRIQIFAGERFSRIINQWVMFVIYGVNSVIGWIVGLIATDPVNTHPFLVYEGMVEWIMIACYLMILMLMIPSIILSGRWIWTNLKELDLKERGAEGA
ncbi:MAG: CDP-alcohol phosphatidyltransferase family protein [Promethearchaeota archaeon]